MGLDITRIGEPQPQPGSGNAPGQSSYAVTTTRLPTGARGDNWLTIFSTQLTGPLLAEHDRTETITVTCNPREYPNWLWLVDIAILRTNEKEDATACP
jgi:hypothetical protein